MCCESQRRPNSSCQKGCEPQPKWLLDDCVVHALVEMQSNVAHEARDSSRRPRCAGYTTDCEERTRYGQPSQERYCPTFHKRKDDANGELWIRVPIRKIVVGKECRLYHHSTHSEGQGKGPPLTDAARSVHVPERQPCAENCDGHNRRYRKRKRRIGPVARGPIGEWQAEYSGHQRNDVRSHVV